MEYTNTLEGTFFSRPNRFIAMVEVAGGVVKCHVKNTGPCNQILTTGSINCSSAY